MAHTPGRPSMLGRIGNALIAAPVYGLMETVPGANVCVPGSVSVCEITAIWLLPLSHIMSSAPFEETRVRKNIGACPGATVATPGTLSTIFQPFAGNDAGGASGTGWFSSFACRMLLNSSTV